MKTPAQDPPAEPQVKHLVEDLCEAFQDAAACWDRRIADGLLGDGAPEQAAKELRKTLDVGPAVLGHAYRKYYTQAGKHFAVGNAKAHARLAEAAQLVAGVVDALEAAHEEAIAGIPCLPGSFHQYRPVDFVVLLQRTERGIAHSLRALEDLFEKIAAWAVPLHTLPPLASAPVGNPESDRDAESFFRRLRSPFHRQRYEYERLPTQYSFRLVRITAVRPYIQCEMATFHLTEPPEFQALSYCWGKGGQTKDIWCNERLFKVSKNLKEGLQRLCRLQSREKWFWIDQICINQNDLTERTQQVRLMRAIYQRAANAVIWLGPDPGHAHDAFSLITTLFQRNICAKDKEALLTKASGFAPGPVDLPLDSDSGWSALSALLDTPWFERCWIIQEVVVSQGNPILMCGHLWILWSQFQEAMAWIRKYHARFRADRMRLINGILDLSSSSDGWELQSLLHSTRAFQATDPRDKVFALLGLAGESRNPENWPKALAPNYSRGLVDVYTEVTLYCIQKTRSLSILSQVEDSTVEHTPDDPATPKLNFPSWVPRWHTPQLAAPLHTYAPVRTPAKCTQLVEKYNRASADLPVSLDPYAPPYTLRLEGLRITTIACCLPAMLPDAPSLASASTSSLNSSTTSLTPSLLERLPEYFALCRTHLAHLTADALLRTFFLVTAAGITPEGEDARHEPLDGIRAFLASASAGAGPLSAKPDRKSASADAHSIHAGFRASIGVSTLALASTEELGRAGSAHGHVRPVQLTSRTSTSSTSSSWSSLSTSTTTTSPSSSQTLSPYGDSPTAPASTIATATATRYTAALTPLLHRRLFITSSGELGLGPAGLMSGDVVAVLLGGKAPFVLRRLGEERWRFVGEAYVSGGVMEGGAVAGTEVGREWEWFELV